MRILPTSKPQVYITMGDPAGIGPEVVAKALASPEIRGLAVFFVIVGDRDVIKNAFGPDKSSELSFYSIAPGNKEVVLREDRINVIDPSEPLRGLSPGNPTAEGASKALECISAAAGAVNISDGGISRAMVTAPVSKDMIARVCPGFVGHTEYLRDISRKTFVTMTLIGNSLTVIPVTRHIPLKNVAGALSKDLITGTLRQVIENRRLICGRDDVRIGVSALNPHAGESGKMGREEINIISPAIEDVRREYPLIEGPISADVIFYRALKKEVDIVISMYHDQCLAPFKMVDFDNGVNMTLGLGFIRTSPDHGTAFDIAGRGCASSGSMERAIKLAVRAINSSGPES